VGYKKFTTEFKRKVVAESNARHEVKSVAKEYGIDSSTLFKWRKQNLDEDKEENAPYSREYIKMVVKTRLTKNNTSKSCSQMFKIPEYLITFWTEKFGDEVRKEIEEEKQYNKRTPRGIRVSSSAVYWK
jgi:transposase-like protein